MCRYSPHMVLEKISGNLNIDNPKNKASNLHMVHTYQPFLLTLFFSFSVYLWSALSILMFFSIITCWCSSLFWFCLINMAVTTQNILQFPSSTFECWFRYCSSLANVSPSLPPSAVTICPTVCCQVCSGLILSQCELFVFLPYLK